MAKSIFQRKKQKQQRLILVSVACLAAVALAVGIIAVTLRGHGDATPSSGGAIDVVPTTTRKTLPKSFIDNNTFSPYVVMYDATANETLYSKTPTPNAIPPA